MAYWTALSVPGGNGLSAAATVAQGATPAAAPTLQSVAVSWAARTLSTGTAVSGYVVKRYDATTLALQTTLPGCAGTVSTLSCTESNVPAGTWRYTTTPVFAANWAGVESALSPTVTVAPIDTVAPANALSLTNLSGNAVLVGTTVYYRGIAGGSFTITNAVTDAGSGPASSATAALGGTSTGFSHTPGTVSTPAGGPYASSAFSWSAGTTSSPTEVVTGRDVQGNATTTTLTFVNSTGPTASISYVDGYTAGKAVSVSFTSASAGPAITARQLQRATATLTGGVCGTFGAFVSIGADNPASPYIDTAVSNGRCYVYRFVVTDALGDATTATSGNVARVDYAGAVSATAGLLSYWRLGEGSASNTSLDSFSGGPVGLDLTAHTGETGATWSRTEGALLALEQIGSAGMVRRSAGGWNIYSVASPPSANYSVQTDLFVKTILANDYAGVTARYVNGGLFGGNYYMARRDPTDNTWKIVKSVNNTRTTLFTSAASTLSVGQSYRLKLEVSGSSTTTLRMSVNGVLLGTATDSTSPLTAAGVPGFIDGDTSVGPSKGDANGIQFDNFQVSPLTLPRATDSKGSNVGDYINGVITAISGALANDTNTAATFDGVNDYVQVANTTGVPVGATARTFELWFKTSSANRQVLYSYGSRAFSQEYGLWLGAGGTTMTAWGYGSDYQFTMPSALNNGAWHHVVQSYNGTSMTIFIDGVALAPQAVPRATVMNQYWLGIGAIIDPGDPNSGGYFTGQIDDVSLYTTALDPATVTNHYQLGTAN